MNIPLTEDSIIKLREDFPILKEKINGKPLVYFDNASTTQKPQAVIQAVTDFYTKNCANIHRGIHTLSERATDLFEQARMKMQKHINAASTKEIIFVRGVTEGINLVAQSFVVPRLKENDEILISYMEHHSNIVPWQLICQQTGAKLSGAA